MKVFIQSILLFSVLSLLLFACTQAEDTPLSYPGEWPYPTIKAPSSSVRVKLSEELRSDSIDGYILDGVTTYEGRKQYGVAFRYTGSWDELFNFINEEAGKAGLKEMKGHPSIFTWLEKDKRTVGESDEVRLRPLGDDCFILLISTV